MKNNESMIEQKAPVIKIAIDMHRTSYRVVRQIGNQTPQPAQKFAPGAFCPWLAKQIEANQVVAVCYEAGCFGYEPARRMQALGAQVYVIADTVSKVIHKRRRKAPVKPSPSSAPIVNNFAANVAEVVKNLPSKQIGSGRKAPRPARSCIAHPARVLRRVPAGSRAPVQRSERTTSHEDLRISSTDDGPPAPPQRQHRKNPKMNSWNEITHYAGFDWAKDHHDVVIVDRMGQIVADFQIEHDAQGWQRWREQLAALGPGVAACVETSQGMIVECLLESEVAVYPVSPVSAKRYRERKVPSGNKTDHVDAWSLADALRVDGHGWKALAKEDPLVAELRLLCRDEIALIEERTALVNQLKQALYEYYPAALEAFDDWTKPAAWAFVEAFSTPEILTKAGKRKWEKFLHCHKLARPETYQKRIEIFARAGEFVSGQALTRAKSRLAVARARVLRTLESQIDAYRAEIEKLFAKHPDHDLFGSLPGAGPKLAPRLLGEIGSDRARFEDVSGLQCLAGTAPVSYQSGQIHKVYIRRQCNKPLRYTVHLWADHSRYSCPWAAVYYEELRKRGKSHACALRCLGQRWLKILWKMWQSGTRYDPELHTKNQIKHGSWVLKMQAA